MFKEDLGPVISDLKKYLRSLLLQVPLLASVALSLLCPVTFRFTFRTKYRRMSTAGDGLFEVEDESGIANVTEA